MFKYLHIITFFMLVCVAHSLHADASAVSYEQVFKQGVGCYRQQQYACAVSAFERAAWLTDNQQQRARAVFNLGNACFFNGQFSQAVVSFKNAGALGIAPDKVQLNLAYARSMYDSLRRQLRDRQKSLQKADWRANARDLPEELLEQLTYGLYLPRADGGQLQLQAVSAAQLSKLLEKSLQSQAGTSVDRGLRRNSWLETTQTLPPGNVTAIFNRLLPMEAGLAVGSEPEPYSVSGQRPW